MHLIELLKVGLLDESLVTGRAMELDLWQGDQNVRWITSASGKENMSQTCKALSGKNQDLSSRGLHAKL